MRNLTLLLILFVSVAEARMYQWTEPDTGTTQLSGKPPAWYRGVNKGPRVFVFDGGRLIDDTDVDVSEETRQRMRQQAFILAEEDREKAKQKIEKSNELKQKFTKKEEDKKETDVSMADEDIVLPDLNIDGFSSEDDSVPKVEAPDNTVEELKKLISDWEASRAEKCQTGNRRRELKIKTRILTFLSSRLFDFSLLIS